MKINWKELKVEMDNFARNRNKLRTTLQGNRAPWAKEQKEQIELLETMQVNLFWLMGKLLNELHREFE